MSDLLPGLRVEALLEALKNAFAREYGAYETLETGALPWADIRPYIEKHASWEWRLGETPKFDLEVEERFPWGNVQLLFSLRHTCVEDVRVFTDALDTELAEDIRARLLGCRFGSEPLAQALESSDKPQTREVAAFIRAQAL